MARGPVADVGAEALPVVLVVDAANVVGSRPDGWWRDRAGATRRLMDVMARLPEADVVGGDGRPVAVVGVAVVLEGTARPAASAAAVGEVQVLLAPGSGDDAVVELVEELGRVPVDAEVVAVTADRGLRARLVVRCWGPGWLRALLDEQEERQLPSTDQEP